MKIIISLVIITIFPIRFLYAQPETEWIRTYGGDREEMGYDIEQTMDGGFIVTGYTNSIGQRSTDLWLIKLDDEGDTLWTRVLGNPIDIEIGRSILQLEDSGFVIAGYATGLKSWDGLLIRTDSNGDTLWTRTFGGDSADFIFEIQQTRDNGYIMIGNTASEGMGEFDIWVLKTDVTGEIEWTRTYGGVLSAAGYSIQQTDDGGYILTGRNTYAPTLGNLWLIKINAMGDSLWSKTFKTWNNLGRSVQQTIDGGYIITGFTQDMYVDANLLLIKTDSNGDFIWIKEFGGKFTDYGWDVKQTSDSGYVVIGYSGFYDHQNLFLIKTNILGDSLWSKTFGGPYRDQGYSVQEVSNGGFILTGYITSYDSLEGYDTDVYVVRLAPDSITDVIDERLILSPASHSLSQNHPNPFNPSTTIDYSLPNTGDVSLIIYNLLGEEVTRLIDEQKPAGNYTVEWNASNFASGIYFYRLQAGDFVQTRKMVLLK